MHASHNRGVQVNKIVDEFSCHRCGFLTVFVVLNTLCTEFYLVVHHIPVVRKHIFAFRDSILLNFAKNKKIKK